jgi:hypothetical protein
MADAYLTDEQMQLPTGRRIKTMLHLGWKATPSPEGETVVGLNVVANVVRRAVMEVTALGGRLSFDEAGHYFHFQVWSREPPPQNR